MVRVSARTAKSRPKCRNSRHAFFRSCSASAHNASANDDFWVISANRLAPDQAPSEKRSQGRCASGNRFSIFWRSTIPTATSPSAWRTNSSIISTVNMGWSAVVTNKGEEKPKVSACALMLNEMLFWLSTKMAPPAASTARRRCSMSCDNMTTLSMCGDKCSVRTTWPIIGSPQTGTKALCSRPKCWASLSGPGRCPARTMQVHCACKFASPKREKSERFVD